MSSINISEADFATVASAAMNAKDKGNLSQAEALDKIARKINAALANASIPKEMRRFAGPYAVAITWEEVPSTLL